MIDILGTMKNMPKVAKFAIPLTIAVVGGFLVWKMFGTTIMIWFLVGLAVVFLILLAFLAIQGAKARKNAAAFTKEMGSAGGHSGVSSAEAMAKLDDMRNKFEEGVLKFNSAGKDLYSMPWYMVVGEPGSGKTEAIRRSNIGFPPGLQDEFQGVGGTINMNWWFTNQAVVLDLAGRLVFEEVKPGGTNEWREFLKMLALRRPNCPVNGMLLIIPVDSLIRDNPDTLKKKAQRLAEQFELVQRTLDVRFPVFVIITKCDLINGFREFFEDLSTPSEQHQILGWSNPQDIDEPLNMGQIAEYMRTVVKRLLDRRQSVLVNPEPRQDLSERRFDEVDSLYVFPQSFRRLLPSLRVYLETIFVAGEWSARPLFLRGIYYTSSMREGAALDDELAKSLGVDAAALPEGRLWDRDRAFFLRDVFLRKIFPEKGLVTRASNVREEQRRRKRALLTVSVIGVATLIGMTWFGGSSLQKSIGAEKDLWKEVAKSADLSDKTFEPWSQIVVSDGADGYTYNGDARIAALGRKMTLAKLHAKLAVITEKPLHIPAAFRLFRPFDRSLERDRQAARRIFFEASVLKPLVEASRATLAATPPEEWTDTHTKALQQILRMEAEKAGLEFSPKDVESGYLELSPLVAVAAGKEGSEHFENLDAEHLKETLEWCFDDGGGEWPPVWAVHGEDLKTNLPLKKALDAFIQYCVSPPSLVDLRAQILKVPQLGEQLKAFRSGPEAEYIRNFNVYVDFLSANLEAWLSLPSIVDGKAAWKENHGKVATAYAAFEKDYGALTNQLALVPFIQQEDIDKAYGVTVTNSLDEAQRRFDALELPGGAKKGLFKALQAKADEAKAGAEKAGKAASRLAEGEEGEEEEKVTLFDNINQRMAEALAGLRKEYLNRRIVDGLKDFKAAWLQTSGRASIHTRLQAELAPPPIADLLVTTPAPWADHHKRFTLSHITSVHKALGDLAEALRGQTKRIIEIQKTIDDKSHPKLAEEPLLLLGKVAEDTLGTKADRSFTKDVEERMEKWRALSGDARKDRDTLLSLPMDAYVSGYQFVTDISAKDYISQYWRAYPRDALRFMGDDVVKAVQESIPALRRYAVFPLDVFKPGGSELLVSDLPEAIKLFNRIRPSPSPDEKKTLGDGQELMQKPVHLEIQRLRTLGLDRMMGWLKPAFTVLDSLPADENSARICTVYLLPENVQQELLLKNNKGQVSDDGARFIWPYLELGGIDASQTRRRYDTYAAQPTPIGKVKYPGTPIELRLFKHKDDAEPDARVTGTGPWSTLQWIFLHGGERQKDNPRRWRVKLTLKDADNHERLLWLELEFETALPEPKDWPDMSKM